MYGPNDSISFSGVPTCAEAARSAALALACVQSSYVWAEGLSACPPRLVDGWLDEAGDLGQRTDDERDLALCPRLEQHFCCRLVAARLAIVSADCVGHLRPHLQTRALRLKAPHDGSAGRACLELAPAATGRQHKVIRLLRVYRARAQRGRLVRQWPEEHIAGKLGLQDWGGREARLGVGQSIAG